MPVAGTSALVAAVTLTATALVILTALEPAPARATAPSTTGSVETTPIPEMRHPQAVAPPTTVAPVTTTTPPPPPPPPTTVIAPPTTHPPIAHPAPPRPPAPVVPVGTHPILPPADPPANIVESPSFDSTCRQDGAESGPCVAATTQATNAARAHEGLGAMVLPSDYAALPAAQQLFVITDIERVDRGLPPVVGMVAQLDTDAQNAAAGSTDPTPSPPPPGTAVTTWASNWAEAAGPLGSNYDWMYDDGPGSGDIDCTAADPQACWGHRNNDLGFGASQIAASHGTLVMGAAEATVPSDSPWTSDATLLALVTGSPTYTYTWAQAQAAGAR
jgi:hypothetical protein